MTRELEEGQRLQITTIEGTIIGRFVAKIVKGNDVYLAIDSVSPKIAGWYKQSDIISIN